jgi:hypothetical protein
VSMPSFFIALIYAGLGDKDKHSPGSTRLTPSVPPGCPG